MHTKYKDDPMKTLGGIIPDVCYDDSLTIVGMPVMKDCERKKKIGKKSNFGILQK